MAVQESGRDDNLFNKLKRLLTSTLVFLTAFILSRSLLQGLIGVLSLWLKYTVQITYSVDHVRPRDYHYWNRLRIGFVYGIPPVFCLGIGLYLLNVLITRKNLMINQLRLFIVWFMFCMINVFLSAMFVMPLGLYNKRWSDGFYQTFSIIGSWMAFNIQIMSIFSVLSIIISLWFGVYIRDEVLKFSYSSRAIKSASGKAMSIFQLYMLPICLGFFPLALISTSELVFPMAFITMNMIIISFGMLAKSFFDNSIVRCGKDDVLNHIPIFELLIAGGVWAWVFFYFK